MTDIKFTFSDLISPTSQTQIKVVVLEGQLDESNVDNFAPNIYELISSNDNKLFIFDIEKLTYMNSKSIGYLSDWYSKITAKSGKMVIAKPQSNIKDILNVVGLDKVIPIAQTIEEAKSFL